MHQKTHGTTGHKHKHKHHRKRQSCPRDRKIHQDSKGEDQSNCKHTTFLEFEIKINGWVELVCDITNEDFDYPIENEIKIYLDKIE